jgi:hypothetical protein
VGDLIPQPVGKPLLLSHGAELSQDVSTRLAQPMMMCLMRINFNWTFVGHLSLLWIAVEERASEPSLMRGSSIGPRQ